MKKVKSLALPGENRMEHNLYKPGFGYLTKHIPKNQQRGHSFHWDEQYCNSEIFEQSWGPRPGPLEFIYNLTQNSKHPIVILNMGAGIGDFTVDLARIPDVIVHHVDFSKQGNKIAIEKIEASGTQDRALIHTLDNDLYLNKFIHSGKKADVVFLYGASGSNEPSDVAYKKTLELSSKALKKGGFIWHVTMIQPRLTNPSDTRIQDTLGDFPKPPGMVREILTNFGLITIKEEECERPDFHPLVPGGESINHLHLVYRGLFRKSNEALNFNFEFRNSVNKNWGNIWANFLKK